MSALFHLTLSGQPARLAYDDTTASVSLELMHGVGNPIEFDAGELPALLDALHAIAMQLPPAPRACRVCGCTDDAACIEAISGDACCWVADDLCSVCAEEGEALS